MNSHSANGICMSLKGIRLDVVTPRLSARFEGPVLAYLKSRDGAIMQKTDPRSAPPAIELVFANGDVEPLGRSPHASIDVSLLGPRVAMIRVHDIEGDACLRISVSDEGQIHAEPSAQTLRRGLMGIRWNVPGIPPNGKLVAPFFQGCRQDMEHPLLASTSWAWPMMWEAGIVIVEVGGQSWSISSRDTRCRPKRLHVGHDADRRTLGIQSESHGPWDDTSCVGSQVWVLDAFDGDWRSPATAYRNWLRDAYNYNALKRLRPDWVNDVFLTLQWQACNPAVLDAVAEKIAPKHVLLHVPDWRTDGYDVNYPEYTASDTGRAFLHYAKERGFRVLPHFNYWGIDPNHPEFVRMSPYLVREAGTGRIRGWRWTGEISSFPQGHTLMHALRDQHLIAYVHPGASAWRRVVEERVGNALRELHVDGALIDQTFVSWNAENALVENLSIVEGAVTLARELGQLQEGIVMAGEGLNEMTAQYQAFAHVHLFWSPFSNHERLHEIDPTPLGAFLYGELCATMGYNGLNDATEGVKLRIDMHRRLGALPTLTRIDDPDAIRSPGPATRSVLAAALENEDVRRLPDAEAAMVK